ncbi:MAG TPA: ribonuclease HII, partial [Epsilonproteobacteria bacterium]|nr:ribonuclease HII [Campylobacterota bacterium]
MPLCGIDEAGRGPLAGPLVIAGVVLENSIAGLDDSKKLSLKRREQLYDLILQNATYHIAIFDAGCIDDYGIASVIKQGLFEITQNLQGCEYLFDGNTSFGVDGIKTLVKADKLV